MIITKLGLNGHNYHLRGSFADKRVVLPGTVQGLFPSIDRIVRDDFQEKTFKTEDIQKALERVKTPKQIISEIPLQVLQDKIQDFAEIGIEEPEALEFIEIRTVEIIQIRKSERLSEINQQRAAAIMLSLLMDDCYVSKDICH